MYLNIRVYCSLAAFRQRILIFTIVVDQGGSLWVGGAHYYYYHPHRLPIHRTWECDMQGNVEWHAVYRMPQGQSAEIRVIIVNYYYIIVDHRESLLEASFIWVTVLGIESDWAMLRGKYTTSYTIIMIPSRGNGVSIVIRGHNTIFADKIRRCRWQDCAAINKSGTDDDLGWLLAILIRYSSLNL